MFNFTGEYSLTSDKSRLQKITKHDMQFDTFFFFNRGTLEFYYKHQLLFVID